MKSLENEVITHIRWTASLPFVQQVEDYFAGYFNELGITIKLKENCTDKQWQALAIELLDYLNNKLPENNRDFCWQLYFIYDDQAEPVGLFFAGDGLADNVIRG